MPMFPTSAGGEDFGAVRSLFGPQQVDHTVRQAIQFCWMSLPSERQNVDEVEKEIRRIVERALKNLREDSASFGLGDAPSPEN